MKKTRHSVIYYGSTHKIETIEIEATDVMVIHGAESDLICWTLAKRTVFAIPFKSLVSSRVVTTLKAADAAVAKLRAV